MSGYIAIFKDPDGFPRAWGKADDEIDAIAIAQLELISYKEEKLMVGDPLADAIFTLEVKEVSQ